MKNSTPTPRLLWRLALVLALALPALARAQDGGIPDSGILYDVPDASVGKGGADQDNPEGDDTAGRGGGACRTSGDCAARFSCSQGTCRYTGIRQAERVGCLLGPQDTLAVVGLGLAVAARRRGREGR